VENVTAPEMGFNCMASKFVSSSGHNFLSLYFAIEERKIAVIINIDFVQLRENQILNVPV
jgi:hypothetical protein